MCACKRLDDVYRVLSSLDTAKAVGLDGIGPKVLRFCAPALSTVLHHLFNCSLSQHSIPAEWRIHCITPIYKSGDRSSVRNYRPISLLSCTSKVLERLVFDRCIEFLESALSSAQFGFLRNRSTLQQLLHLRLVLLIAMKIIIMFDLPYCVYLGYRSY